MSENPPPKKARVARGKSDGKYLGAHGPTNKFQSQWLEHPAPEGQPQRKDWLSDGGVGRNELVPSPLQHLPSHFPVQDSEHCVP